MSLRRYPEYKASGARWLGNVPAQWQLVRLRRCIALNPSKAEIAALPRTAQVSFIPMEAVGDSGTLSLAHTRPVGDVENGYTYFRDGDVTFAKITPCFENGKGALMRGLLGGVGFGTTELTVARPIPDRMTPDYLHWLFRSSAFRAEGEASMYGAGGQKRVPDDFVRELLWVLPSLAEQEAIASFLGRETAKIDALIAEQEKLLALLAEKRQATISHAVTRGLDPAVRLKDSGIPWLGQVPVHWDIMPLARITLEKCDGPFGSGIKSDHYTDEGALVIRLQNIRQSGYHTGDAAYLDIDYFNASLKRHSVAPGDLLIAGLGDERNLVGRACVAPDNLGPALVKADCFRFRLIDAANASFVAAQLNASASFDAGTMATGTTRSRIPLSAMGSRVVALPPWDEQTAVVAHIDRATRRTERLMSEARDAIALLGERRAALITAAVTGQIDVRGVTAVEVVA